LPPKWQTLIYYSKFLKSNAEGEKKYKGSVVLYSSFIRLSKHEGDINLFKSFRQLFFYKYLKLFFQPKKRTNITL